MGYGEQYRELEHGCEEQGGVLREKFAGEDIRQQLEGPGDLAQQTEVSCHGPELTYLMIVERAEETIRIYFYLQR